MADFPTSAPNLAIFCDFENVAIGVRDANYKDFDVHMVLERLLDKGKIVVKKAYADWSRYKNTRRSMHEAAFEMIEIPHVSYSGKNSADIRLVVDALDLCYTKPHIDHFVIVSGDSDFSPLVSKLRENDKIVIGLGVKNSSSDLLIENCDEFIYYDDLERKRRQVERGVGAKKPRKRPGPGRDDSAPPVAATGATSVSPAAPSALAAIEPPPPPEAVTDADAPAQNGEELEERRQQALDHVLDVVEALFSDRDAHLWGSMVKQTLKRKRPNFSERFHGYRTFSELLEDAQKRGLLELSRDERSGGYLITSFGPNA
ncbi:MAG: NYN domain-containing protein [Sandaracinaceae bacterium]|nr:NYN domain-containing protein [Sandaracinaceae bacterium]